MKKTREKQEEAGRSRTKQGKVGRLGIRKRCSKGQKEAKRSRGGRAGIRREKNTSLARLRKNQEDVGRRRRRETRRSR